jgi:hypothetical protein
VLCDVSRKETTLQEPSRLWLDIEDAGSAATPAPVKKLLQTFA